MRQPQAATKTLPLWCCEQTRESVLNYKLKWYLLGEPQDRRNFLTNITIVWILDWWATTSHFTGDTRSNNMSNHSVNLLTSGWYSTGRLMVRWVGGRSPLEYLDLSVETGLMTDYKTCHLLKKVLCIDSLSDLVHKSELQAQPVNLLSFTVVTNTNSQERATSPAHELSISHCCPW